MRTGLNDCTNPSVEARHPFPHLSDPARYRACDWDLLENRADREFWVKYFIHHTRGMGPLLEEAYPSASAEQIHDFFERHDAAFRDVAQRPQRYPRIDILLFDDIHAAQLTAAGFSDPYLPLKRRVNDAAMDILPDLLRELDTLDAVQLPERLVLGLLAGNLFDMGAPTTAAIYARRGDSFSAALADLKPRPWFIDHFEAWRARWKRQPCGHVAFFIDNSGSDFVLGTLPLIRWMLERGSRVTVIANERPALNDVTIAELRPLLDRAAQIDHRIAGAICEQRLRCVSSGTGAPLVNLAGLSAACCAAVADCDLVMLHGMGRAIESNWLAEFRIDSLRSALIKEPVVAKHIGAETYDCVFRFEPAPQ